MLNAFSDNISLVLMSTSPSSTYANDSLLATLASLDSAYVSFFSQFYASFLNVDDVPVGNDTADTYYDVRASTPATRAIIMFLIV